MKLHGRFLEGIEDVRLRHVKWQATTHLFRLVEQADCRHASILGHFGEEIRPCGTSCDVCTGVTVEELAAAGACRPVALRSRRVHAAGAMAASTAWDSWRKERAGGASSAEAEAVFERLRGLRKRLADEAGVSAWIVFNDETLQASGFGGGQASGICW